MAAGGSGSQQAADDAVAKALTMLPRCRAVLTDMLGPAYRFWGAVSTPIGDAPVPGAAVAKDPTADPT